MKMAVHEIKSHMAIHFFHPSLLAVFFLITGLLGCQGDGIEITAVEDTVPKSDADRKTAVASDSEEEMDRKSDTGGPADSEWIHDGSETAETDTDTRETEEQTVFCDGRGPGPGQYFRWIEFDDRLRNYHLHIPPGYDGTVGLPLVFDLHAHPTTATIMNLLSGFRDKADKEGFIVVQPNGVGMGWNAGPKCCGVAAEQNVDDVGFIRAIRDELAEELCLDLKRVYVDGMSSGGYLAHRIACEETDLVAAIGPVMAAIAFANLDECQPSRPLPITMISGSADEFQEKKETFEKWLALNGCSQFFDPEYIGVFSCKTYRDCRDGVETTHCIGENVGHCWPGTASDLVSLVYPCSDDLITTDYLWDFFARQRIP